MFTALIVSTLIAGTAAIGITLMFLYLPLLWGGRSYDVLNAMGSAVTEKVGGRSALIGLALYSLGGLFFALLYGLVAQAIVSTEAGSQVSVLTFPLIGAALGLAHGGIVALLVTVVVIEHHPLERFRERYTLVVSQILAHVVFGASVMLLHRWILGLPVSA